MVPRTVGNLSTEELQRIIEQTIDRRLSVWLTQILDALTALEDEEGAQLRPRSMESLRRALEQADTGDVLDLQAFRRQLEG
jgi:predicted Ser/Thr protein kinase